MGAIDTSSPHWQLVCLALHICRLPSKQARHEFMDELERTVIEQWPLVRAEVTQRANA